jgi:galactoside O-acetyltransferase
MRKILRKLEDFISLRKIKDLSKNGEFLVDSSTEIRYSQIRYKSKSSLIVGSDSLIEAYIAFEQEGTKILIGDRTFIGSSTTISVAEQVSIGDDVLISWGVNIVDHNSHAISFSKRKNDVLDWKKGKKDWLNVAISPVNIGNKVWIGSNSIILKGVTIGEGSIIGAGAVVTNDVPPWTIVAGNPARVIREIPEDER